MRKKILFIVEAMGGGIFTYIVNLSNELVKKFDLYIAYAVRKQTPPDYRSYFDPQIRLIEVKNFVRSINILKDVSAFVEIREIAEKIQPDIIHLHSSKAGALGRFAFNGRKIPLFYTPHGYSFLMKNYGYTKRTLYKIIEYICARRKCITISCSEGEHQETLKLTPNALYINNGINVDELQMLTKHTKRKQQYPFTVFTLGRICYQKNPELFNQIAEALPDIHFLWIGGGELREKLTAPNVEVTSWVEREMALAYSLNGNVFVLTSLWEGLPLSLLESMYMKKVCIVSNVIGNRDVIHHGINGFICNDLDDYVKAIKFCKNNDTSNLINNAYEEVLTVYNTTVIARKYEKIYEERLNG